MPQYVVATQATVISRTSSGEEHDAAASFSQEGRDSTQDLSSGEFRKLKFKGRPKLEADIKKASLCRSDRSQLLSASKGQRDAEITQSEHGFLGALFALKMAIVTFDSGVTFKAWLADGYLGEACRS